MMRKLVVTMIVSANGCSAGEGDNVMALPMDPAFDSYNLERLQAAGTLLLGRTTYDGFRSYWPTVEHSPQQDDTNKAISRRNNEIQKVVVSDTLTDDETDPWTDTTTIVRRADAHDHLAALKAGDGGDIVMFGSRTLWNDLFRAGLVDEVHLMVGQVVLAGGVPAFEEGSAADLALLDVRRFDDSQNVLLRYSVR
jgi:dihydrofolate reductase